MLPLFVPLSQALVAFTIEFDNEFEHRMPHWTTDHGGSRQGPWLVSMAMWFNCMRFAGEEGVTVRELERLAHTKTNLDGMRRWGYITIENGSVLRATPNGRMAQQVWRPLFAEVQNRWRARFGDGAVDKLRAALLALVSRMAANLPDCLPILAYGLFSRVHSGASPATIDAALPLPSLLSRVLLSFATEFESEADLSLALCANILRVLDQTGVRVRDLPLLSGVSKEAIKMGLGILQKKRLALEAPDPAGGRGKVVRLTEPGRQAQAAYARLTGIIEGRWRERFGAEAIAALRTSLEPFAGAAAEPYPEGWRAALPKPQTLPYFPMVLHRGGFPDGS